MNADLSTSKILQFINVDPFFFALFFSIHRPTCDLKLILVMLDIDGVHASHSVALMVD